MQLGFPKSSTICARIRTQWSTPGLRADDHFPRTLTIRRAVTFLKDPYAKLRLGVPEWVSAHSLQLTHARSAAWAARPRKLIFGPLHFVIGLCPRMHTVAVECVFTRQKYHWTIRLQRIHANLTRPQAFPYSTAYLRCFNQTSNVCAYFTQSFEYNHRLGAVNVFDDPTRQLVNVSLYAIHVAFVTLTYGSLSSSRHVSVGCGCPVSRRATESDVCAQSKRAVCTFCVRVCRCARLPCATSKSGA